MLQKLEKIMLSKRTVPFLILVMLAGVLGSVSCKGKMKETDTTVQQQQLLMYIGMVLERDHYSPKPIDDAFSKVVFDKYMSSIDNQFLKDNFLQSDIDSLKGLYYTKLDDEIHGTAKMSFFLAAVEVLNRRSKEVDKFYNEILAKPFKFTDDETYQSDKDTNSIYKNSGLEVYKDQNNIYPKNDQERYDVWRKKLKYQTLTRFVDLQNQRDKAADTSSLKKKSDADLEKEAREAVKKMMDRAFKKSKSDFDEEQQYSLFVNTICKIMDPHTDYFPPIEKREFDAEMGNSFFGIGAQLQETPDGTIKIVDILKGLPAYRTGKMKVNDVIQKVAQGDGPAVDISGYSITDAVKLIRGAKGSVVTLTMKRATDGTVYVLSIVRDEVKQDELAARSAVINQNGKKIGYLYLPEFYNDFNNPNGAKCAVDVRNEIIKLKKDSIQGLVFDLRSNNGGSLMDVIQIVGLFVPQGPVVQVRDRNGKVEQLKDEDKDVLYDGPMTVMINNLSASAAEIFAAAIQDYHRGVIIGSDSYGKGTVQRQMMLGKANENGDPEFGALKLTFQKFYRVNGGSTQRKGVVPDVVLPDQYSILKLRETDAEFSLPYDKITPASITYYTPKYDAAKIVHASQTRVNENAIFTAIQKNIDWFKKNEDKPISLNLIKYKEERAAMSKINNKDDSLFILKQPLSVKIASDDYNKVYKNDDSAKGKRYQDWYKALGKDVYIKEASNTILDMISTKLVVTEPKKK
ncbi:tail-specific protease [Rhizosphaericola mali]|uniref:Tail-specific protease n=2 Tax=Rhizosphaericola mali TaxID=2545455 RepID=A0A5P2G424_9BACT|nr:tail-specific protease [Rhizosphaericola mali]